MGSLHGFATAHWDHELDSPRRRPRPRKTSRPVEDEDEDERYGSWESPSESQYLLAVFDAALEFGSLELLFGKDHVPAFAHFERAASGASFDELKKPGELAWSQLEISIPEFIPQKRDGNRAARDGLENDGCVRAEFGVTFEVTLPVNTPLPHRGPLQGCAVLDRPESGIANARGQCARTQHFEIWQRVFQRPGRVPRIHRG